MSFPSSTDLSGQTVLFVHAHPDDEAIFTAVTMRRLADAGARVVLVTATGGEAGEPLAPLPHGLGLGDVRRTELELACATLGVARLVMLGRRDSGERGSPDNGHPDALTSADAAELVGLVAAVAAEERAGTVVGYEPGGITGHPDHLLVHHVARAAAERVGADWYEVTLDREALHFADVHLAEYGRGTRGPRPTVGHATVEISTAVVADDRELAVKRAAMAAHASQIPLAALCAADFAATYGTEWYLRHGSAGVIELLGNEHALAASRC